MDYTNEDNIFESFVWSFLTIKWKPVINEILYFLISLNAILDKTLHSIFLLGI